MSDDERQGVEWDLIRTLKEVASSKDPELRQKKISTYQDIVWNMENVSDDEEIDDEMGYLAYILDLYQPNEVIRRGSDALYDDKKLEEILKEFFAWYEEACKRKGRRCAE